ncbi:dihydrofolate reductase [Shimia sp. R9_1]|uniref:dihydrofolate reductase family protein n=1 Tax=Shimia sp. R9_1 TaxID=2821111 RepID=UPI001ADA7E9B|nr:dihydrofolate reductase family protein [Shimia sp. R9_1]MBO9409125.1 dihydrofolate reductase [Shimia sp. R9_1]
MTQPRYLGYIAMSLDGFIARPDGGIDWLDPFNSALAEGGDDGGYSDFIAPIDAVLMGRSTYQQVMRWGWPYETRAGYVLTRQDDFTGDHVTAAGDIDTLRAAIAANGHKTIWVMGGGETQRAALDVGMFDAITLFVMPTLLGAGLPCFTPGAQRDLDLTQITRKPGGIVQLDYKFKEQTQ